MEVLIITDSEKKQCIVEECDIAFENGIVGRDNYDEIFRKIDRNAIFIAAFEETTTIGYVAIYANNVFDNVAFITMIGVMPNMQDKHVGSALLKKSLSVAKENKMEYVRLEVKNTNSKAILFYEHHGFKYEKECTKDSNYMIKRL